MYLVLLLSIYIYIIVLCTTSTEECSVICFLLKTFPTLVHASTDLLVEGDAGLQNFILGQNHFLLTLFIYLFTWFFISTKYKQLVRLSDSLVSRWQFSEICPSSCLFFLPNPIGPSCLKKMCSILIVIKKKK